ncbi:MAG: protein tyrosine phosphatase (PTP) superfamily phosphohydrolase (DUF442 family) [Candidatus Azotimanducaceae bacterium]|jgi:protein tyrosine phosphatase (PTP) superfamily phosphohydrolase (DUF442 family)
MLDDITNYHQMTERVATSGQPTVSQFSAIAAADFTVVINLAMPDGDHALVDEGSVVSRLGMTYVHIPVPWEAPGLNHLNQFIAVMKATVPARVWVHCVVNARVSAFNYHYLKSCLGLPEAECRSPLLDKWEPQMDAVWQQFLAIPVEQIEA